MNSRQGTAHCEQGTTFWRIVIATPYMLRDETKKKAIERRAGQTTGRKASDFSFLCALARFALATERWSPRT